MWDALLPEPHDVIMRHLKSMSRVGGADSDGHIDFRAAPGSTGIILTHEQGYAEVSLAALQLSPEIQLRPWGHAEGQLLSGKMPFAGETVALWRNDYELSLVSVSTETGPDGSFTFHELPAGEYRLRTEIETTLVWVQVEAGKTTHLNVGQDGRTIRGHAKADRQS
jgi:hypothetical protein